MAQMRVSDHLHLQMETPAPDPANYRPIQNQNALAKLYHIILQQLLDAFAEQQGLRAEGQAGFRPQRRTSDGVLVPVAPHRPHTARPPQTEKTSLSLFC